MKNYEENKVIESYKTKVSKKVVNKLLIFSTLITSGLAGYHDIGQWIKYPRAFEAQTLEKSYYIPPPQGRKELSERLRKLDELYNLPNFGEEKKNLEDFQDKTANLAYLSLFFAGGLLVYRSNLSKKD